MLGDLRIIKVIDTMAKVFTLPFGIQKSKLINIALVAHAIAWFLLLLQVTFLPPKQYEKEKQHTGIGVPQPNIFTSGKGYVPLISIQDQIFKKLLLCPIRFLVRISNIKVCHDYTPRWHRPLLHELSTMIYISKFLNNGQLFASNKLWMCIFNMCLHGNDPINFTIFDKAFS